MFTPPKVLTPYLPPANTVTVEPITPSQGGPGTDQYAVTPTDTTTANAFVLSVTAGTSAVTVNALASGNVSWTKFRAATLSPGDVNPIDYQVALTWFMQYIGRPYYGL